MCKKNLIEYHDDTVVLTDTGTSYFEKYQINIDQLQQSKRAFIRPCLDWSERQHHLAGSVGNAFFEHGLREAWFIRERHSRVITVTEQGRNALERDLGISL